jgi:NADPH2:quinone reductase
MTHAIRIHRFGGPEVLQWEEISVGAPAAGQLRLRHTAAGLNFVDVVQRRGAHGHVQLPLVMGRGGAGVVEAVGEGVKGFAPGDRVAYAPYNGAYAEERLIGADKVVKIPEGVDDKAAGASILQGLTVHYLVRQLRDVGRGDVLLVHAAAGGIGLILCQWAAALGATVIGAVSTRDKAQLARANGCAHTIVYSEGDFVQQAMALNGGRKLDAVYDAVGKDTFMRSLGVLRPGGQIISFGRASGPIPPLDVGDLTPSSLTVSAGTLMAFTEGLGRLQQMGRDWFDMLRSGKVKVTVNQTYAMKDAARAHSDLEARKTTGSTALVP